VAVGVQLVVELPYNFVQVSVYCLITFFMIGVPRCH